MFELIGILVVVGLVAAWYFGHLRFSSSRGAVKAQLGDKELEIKLREKK
jgi:hypothetical protein